MGFLPSFNLQPRDITDLPEVPPERFSLGNNHNEFSFEVKELKPLDSERALANFDGIPKHSGVLKQDQPNQQSLFYQQQEIVKAEHINVDDQFDANQMRNIEDNFNNHLDICENRADEDHMSGKFVESENKEDMPEEENNLEINLLIENISKKLESKFYTYFYINKKF